MLQLTKLRAAKSIYDLAQLLNFKPSTISYLLFKLKDADRYKEFEISKQSGGKRKIAAPTAKLKKLQSNLSNLLTNCLIELETAGERNSPFVQGFVRGKSIVTNARLHRNKRWVLNIDIEDFFESINFGRVRGLLMADKAFKLDPVVATLIAQIACRNNSLPQGAPTSPILSNMVARPLDLKLIDLANRHGLRYSRYADDITFSTRIKEFPAELVKKGAGEQVHDWAIGGELSRALTKSGFAINGKKTRLQHSDSRQAVTGLVVNDRVNVTREYRKLVRAMVHTQVTTGGFQLSEAMQKRVANKHSGGVNPLNQLQGMLGFIDWVDIRAKAAKMGAAFHIRQEHVAKNLKAFSSQERLYRKFLFFREFQIAATPIIITEGKTDKVHISAAVKALANQFPTLATIENGKPKLSFRLFPCLERRTNALLGLTGGTSQLSDFVANFEAETKNFFKPTLAQPIIVIADKDTGWSKVGGAIKAKTGKLADGTQPFYVLSSNLYVICIPPPPGKETGAIEDLYPKEVLEHKIGIKTFNKSNNTKDDGIHYGKAAFAREVIQAKACPIDFTGFTELLHRISEVIVFHTSSAVAAQQVSIQ